MTNRSLACALLLSTLACAAQHAGGARPNAAVLLQADRDFARDTAARGTAGWVAAFADDGAMLLGGSPPLPSARRAARRRPNT
jgi:hypothetical protein